MTYNLEYIFEGFQSRMKSKLKELSDEDEVRRKMLQNTFYGIDIHGMEKAKSYAEVVNIMSRNIDGNIYISKDASGNIARNNFNIKSTPVIVRKPKSSNKVCFYCNDFDDLDVECENIHEQWPFNFFDVIISIYHDENEFRYLSNTLSFFVSDKEYTYSLSTDFENKSITDYGSTSEFIRLCNYVISDQMNNYYKEFPFFLQKIKGDINVKTKRNISFVKQYFIKKLMRHDGIKLKDDDINILTGKEKIIKKYMDENL